jgi:hypothetical protein
MNLEQVVRNVDRRLGRVEQILPTLPTREELDRTLDRKLDERLATLVTKEDFNRTLDERLATLVTKEDFNRTLDERLATLVTKEGFNRTLDERLAALATKEDLREAFERSSTRTLVLFEDLKGDIRLLADGMVNLQASLDRRVYPRLDDHERRITALEVRTEPGPTTG